MRRTRRRTYATPVITTTEKLWTVRMRQRLPEDVRCEIIGGQQFMCPSPTFDHQTILLRLATALHGLAARNSLGTVVLAPFDVILSDVDVVQPDIIVVSPEHRDRIRDWMYGAPDLAVEILSPGNMAHDRRRKRELYFRMGFPEFWIVDPATASIDVLVREPTRWRTHGTFSQSTSLSTPFLRRAKLALSPIFAKG